jgi:Excreted virulence factor EspC, type VII ESX diderm
VAEIQVSPQSLQAAGAAHQAAAESLASLGRGVSSSSAGAGSMGDAVSAGAYARMCQIWGAELEGLGEMATGIARSVNVASLLYPAVDRSVMPASKEGP